MYKKLELSWINVKWKSKEDPKRDTKLVSLTIEEVREEMSVK